MSHQVEIPVTEEFSDELGRFFNYDAYDDTAREVIANQRHTDIRSFISTPWQTLTTVGKLEGTPMSDLQGDQVQTLDDPIDVIDDENWTLSSGSGTLSVGADATRNNWNLLSFVTTGATTAKITSIMPLNPVDLSDVTDGVISLTLPGLPLPSLTLSSCYVYLSTSATGTFTVADDPYTSNLPFSLSTTTLVNGNSQATWNLQELLDRASASFDISRITGIQLQLTFTGAATVKAGGLRWLSPDWKYLPVDLDTRYGVLRRTVSRDGLTTAPYDATMPILWRSDNPSSPADPRPTDANLAVTFNTGALSQTNQFSIYMRETNKDFLTQLDLNGLSQNALNQQPQPDIGEARWNPRPQTDLERYDQTELEDEVQYTLERTADAISSSYIEFVFQWSATGGVVLIRNSEGNGYSFTVNGLTADTNYIGIAELEGTTARAVIYPIDGAGNIDATNRVFDSNWIDDDFVFKRRQGRIGWFAQLLDGNAYIDGVRSRGMTFAEQRLLPYESVTPVEGAQLFAEFSPNRELVLGVDERNGATVVPDNSTAHGESYKVTVTGANQGIHTTVATFNSFDDTDVVLSLLLPQTAVDAGGDLRVLLTNDQGREIELNLGAIIPDQWNTKRLPLAVLGDTIQTGSYRFAIVNKANATFTFWVDNPISISERSVVWSGRGVVDDPWKSNDAKWVDFLSEVNDQRGGVQFYQRGNQLQVRARARKQNAHIGRPKIKPKYAQLGRLIFEPKATIPALTTGGATITVTNPSTRTAGVSVPETFSNRVALYEWSFGDGAVDFGTSAQHTYKQAGTYPITLTVTDIYGQRTVLSASAVV
jgi:hypothetical protein